MKSRLPAIEQKLPAAVQKALEDGAARITADAKLRAPVRTGALKESIEARPGVFRIHEQPAPGIGVYAAWYYIFAEFGTKNQAAQPFMVPAAESERPRLIGEVKKALGDL